MNRQDKILIDALVDIKNWDDGKDEQWGYPGARAIQAIADYSKAASQFPSQGLPFIKASERLPEPNIPLWLRLHGTIKCEGFLTGWKYFSTNSGQHAPEEVEWLDESAPSQGLREVIEAFVKDYEEFKNGGSDHSPEKIYLMAKEVLTSTPDGSQRKFKYNAENGYWWDENGTPFLSEELSEIISGSHGLREALEKIAEKTVNGWPVLNDIEMNEIATEALKK